MNIRLGVVMDPIGSIKVKKDSTFAMLLQAQARGWELWYMEQEDLFLEGARAHSGMRRLQVTDAPNDWFRLTPPETRPLDELQVILMRKDPPFDMDYIYATYLLERAESEGTLVVNRPAALRDCNEKLFTAWFPECCPPNLVTGSHQRLRAFLEQQRDIIIKPLGTMGGASIFRVRQDDPNCNVIFETLTGNGRHLAMAQRFIPEIADSGDKRILMVDGEAIPYALARIPKPGETRGNLAAGGTGRGVALSERDHWIADRVGPELRRRGILFAGLDVIGDYLTEINVTSPTCIRELDSQFGLNIGDRLMDRIEERIGR
ncbi:MAG: glutathione synthase [Candidatus Sedimenticola endophacoides]